MNSNIFADTFVQYKNNHFNLLHLVYYNLIKCKRSNCIPKSLSLKKRIVYLNLENKQLEDLELNNLHFLKILNCKKNKLTSFKLKHIPQLEYLNCDGNKLTSLNLKHNPQLKKLDCQSIINNKYNCQIL